MATYNPPVRGGGENILTLARTLPELSKTWLHRWVDIRSSPIWCGSVQVENKLARSAGSSYRFGIRSWEGHREATQEQEPECWRPTRSAFPPPFAKGTEGRPRAGATRL